MKPLLIVTGKHSEEGLLRFRSLPGCRVVTAESPGNLQPEDLAEAELFAGWITPHISGGYRAGVNYDRVIDTAVQNLTLVLQGKPPIHAVDRMLGY